jgi:hypothetical protein
MDQYRLQAGVVQSGDGCYVIANKTLSDAGGYKTQSSRGVFDFWSVKLCEELHAAFSTAAQQTCAGGCVNFSNSSTFATTYQWSFPGGVPAWSSSANPSNICYSTPGTYDVELIAVNGMLRDTLNLANYITVYPQPASQSILQSGDTLFSNQGFNSYQWYHNGTLILGATNEFFPLTDDGNYNVISTDVNGCEVEAAIFDVHIGIEEFSNEILLIVPNPVHSELEITSQNFNLDRPLSIYIYDIIGSRVITRNDPLRIEHMYRMDVSDLIPGVYFLEFISDDRIFYGKFIKR